MTGTACDGGWESPTFERLNVDGVSWNGVMRRVSLRSSNERTRPVVANVERRAVRIARVRRSGVEGLQGKACGRGGQALLEFAIVAFVLTLLLAGMIAMGFALLSAHVLTQAADVAAQELARHPAPATWTFQEGLADSGLYDETALILPAGFDASDPANGLASLPLVNRMLFPLYRYDPDRGVLRYPGAVVDGPTGLTVLIPIVATNASGVQEITEWLRPIEEITAADPVSGSRLADGPYALDATAMEAGSLDPGMVALRMNYPYQSPAMIASVRVDAGGNVVPSTVVPSAATNRPVAADDSITAAALPTGYTLSTITPPVGVNGVVEGSGANRGDYGLGEVFAYGTAVRPYRAVLSAQGIARREVLLP